MIERKVEVLDTGKLTPQQILSGCLFDEIEDIETVIVIRITKDGDYIASWSNCEASRLALAALMLQDKAMELAKE